MCNKTIIRYFFCNIEQLLDEDFVISGINLALRGRDPCTATGISNAVGTSYNVRCRILWRKVTEALGTRLILNNQSNAQVVLESHSWNIY